MISLMDIKTWVKMVARIRNFSLRFSVNIKKGRGVALIYDWALESRLLNTLGVRVLRCFNPKCHLRDEHWVGLAATFCDFGERPFPALQTAVR